MDPDPFGPASFCFIRIRIGIQGLSSVDLYIKVAKFVDNYLNISFELFE